VPYPCRRHYRESLVNLNVISGPLLRTRTAVEIFGHRAVRSSRDGWFPSDSPSLSSRARLWSTTNQNDSLSVRVSIVPSVSLPYFYLPQFDIQNGKEWPRACVLSGCRWSWVNGLNGWV